ncbi:hypothetical protein LTR36_007067 [Oleoguttula mirabilis]|uniref:F-box domain-containing protein n=1 Tax=Oleoguttula mirabilis TaxID=1507867 RepID=A0AAV9JAT5_9PEZI|nr:hypothetical protein LTR36_007067 [Oleoguttula mirabilis]
MPLPAPVVAASTPTHLPDELWLHILTHLPAKDVWASARPLTPQLTRLCEELATSTNTMRNFTVGISFSLGAGARHRWYDIRGTLTFSFQRFSEYNARYVLFGACLAHPSACYGRAMEKWRGICGGGGGGEDGAEGLGLREEWRVQYGYEGDVKVVRLPKLIVASEADGGGVWCDWRELFDAYYGVLRGDAAAEGGQGG